MITGEDKYLVARDGRVIATMTHIEILRSLWDKEGVHVELTDYIWSKGWSGWMSLSDRFHPHRNIKGLYKPTIIGSPPPFIP